MQARAFVMQAIHISDSGALRWESVATPSPGPHELLVQVAATAVNRADLLQRAGKYPPPSGASPILGLEIAGDVIAHGAQCSRFRKGDRVFGLVPGGGYAEQAVIDESMAMPIPAGMTAAQAAALPEACLTAFQALSLIGGGKEGEWALIHTGASGVGTAALQIARLLGLRAIATCAPQKMSALDPLGAALVLPGYNLAAHRETIRQHTGAGVDLIIDTLGPAKFAEHLELLNLDGRLVMLAMLSGSRVPESDLRVLLQKRLTITGTTLRNRPLSYQRQLVAQFWQFAVSHLERGTLRPVVGTILPIVEAEAAHRLLEERSIVGKIVLTVSSPRGEV